MKLHPLNKSLKLRCRGFCVVCGFCNTCKVSSIWNPLHETALASWWAGGAVSNSVWYCYMCECALSYLALKKKFFIVDFYRCPHFPPFAHPTQSPLPTFPVAITVQLAVSVGCAYMFFANPFTFFHPVPAPCLPFINTGLIFGFRHAVLIIYLNFIFWSMKRY